MRDPLVLHSYVSHVGNSGAIPDHDVGDVIVIAAPRAGSTTSPTIPGGWTSLSTGGNNSNISMSVAYKVAASDAEVSGTWTNASRLHIAVLRGTFRSTPHGGVVTVGNSDVTNPPTNVPGAYGGVLSFATHNSTTEVDLTDGQAGTRFLETSGAAPATSSWWEAFDGEIAGEPVSRGGVSARRMVRVHFAIPLEAGVTTLQSNQPVGVHLISTAPTGGSGALTRFWQRKVGAGAWSDYNTVGVLSDDEIWDWDVTEGTTYFYRQRQVVGSETVNTNEVEVTIGARGTGSVVEEMFNGRAHLEVPLGIQPVPNSNFHLHTVRANGASGDGLALRHLPTTTGSGDRHERFLPLGIHYEGEVLIRHAVQRKDSSSLSGLWSTLLRTVPGASSWMQVRLRGTTLALWRQNPNSTRQTASYTMEPLRWEWVRIRYQGDNFKVRVWKEDEAEPGTWQIDNTDTHAVANETNGWFFFGGGNFIPRFYDYIAFIREGSGTVPLPDWATRAVRRVTSPLFGQVYDGSISLSWTAALSADHYEIEWAAADGDWEALDQPPSNSYSWDTSTLPNGAYKIRVRAIDGAVEGPWRYVDTFYVDHEDMATRMDPQALSTGAIGDLAAADLEHMFNQTPEVSVVEVAANDGDALLEGRKAFRIAGISGGPWSSGLRIRSQRWWDHADWVARLWNVTQSASGDAQFTGVAQRGQPGSSVANRRGYSIGHHPTNGYVFFQVDGDQRIVEAFPNFSSQVEPWFRHRGRFSPDGMLRMKVWLDELEIEPAWMLEEELDEPSLGGWVGFGEWRLLGNSTIQLITILPLGTELTPPEIQGPDEGAFIKGPNVPVTWTESVNRVED
jgi:hypothetical protein